MEQNQVIAICDRDHMRTAKELPAAARLVKR